MTGQETKQVTITIPEEVWAQLKKNAIDAKVTLKKHVVTVLTESL